MAANLNGFVIIDEPDPKFTFQPNLVTSGAVGTISAGSPTKGADATAASPWTGAVVPMVDGDGTSSQRFTGLCKSTSTDTAAANGVTTIWMPLPGLVYAGKAKSATLANTAALVQAYFGKRVVFDLTSSVWTVDSAAADAAVNMVTIIGGDFNTSTLYFTYKVTGTVIGQIA